MPLRKLQNIAATRGLLFGVAVGEGVLDNPDNTERERLIARQCSVLVSENEMKWAAIHPAENQYCFAAADNLLKFARKNKQKVRGHTLCWHKYNPPWLTAKLRDTNRSRALGLLRKHIECVVDHFKGQIHSWDVVNEASIGDGYGESRWLAKIGSGYIRIAFEAAASADPKAKLTYNDFGLERSERKQQAVLTMLRDLLDQNTPIHALGLQAHLKASDAERSWESLHTFLEDVEDLGLEVFITEMDVDDGRIDGSPADRDQVVAHTYRDFLENVLCHRNLKAVLTWGLDDSHSWLQKPRQRRKRPLLFSRALQPKPAFYAVYEAF